jgi:hypothetical protein
MEMNTCLLEVSLGVIMTYTEIFHIFHIISLFNLLSSIFSISFHFSTYFSSIFSISFHISSIFSISFHNFLLYFRKYRRKVSWNVKWYGKYGRKVSWNVKWYGKYRRKVSHGPIRHIGAKKKLQLKHKNSLFTLQTFHYNYYSWSQSLLNRFGWEIYAFQK